MNAISKRLDLARKVAGFTELKALYRALVVEKDGESGYTLGGERWSLSYEAMRTYHNGRVPPIHYVGRLCEVLFGANRNAWLTWMVFGETSPVMCQYCNPIDGYLSRFARDADTNAVVPLHPELACDSCRNPIRWR